MSHSEAMAWAAYRNKYGSLHIGRRLEQSFGLMASMYANVKRKEGTPAFSRWDFMDHEDPPPVALESAMEEWC